MDGGKEDGGTGEDGVIGERVVIGKQAYKRERVDVRCEARGVCVRHVEADEIGNSHV